MCVCVFFVAVFSILSVNTIIIVCVSVCDAGDNIDQKKEKLYIIRTVFYYMRIVPVCEEARERNLKKTYKQEEMSPPAGFPPYLCSLPVLNIFVCVLLLSILSSLDIFLFVSLYTYILFLFAVKGSILSMQLVICVLVLC